MKKTFVVTGMSCAACSSRVEKSVSEVQGVDKVNVNLLTNTMTVIFKDKDESEEVIRAVKQAGYGVNTDGETKIKSTNAPNYEKPMIIRLIVSAVFWIPLMIVSMGHMFFKENVPIFYKTENAGIFVVTQIILLLPIIFANQKYFTNGFKALIKRSPNMDSLVAVGASAAIIYGVFALYQICYGLGHGNVSKVEDYLHDLYFESVGTILTLITLGKFLESRSKGKTSEAISKLLNLAPQTAHILKDGEEIEVVAEEIKVGDIFLVKPGESVPCDGEVIEGNSTFDESAVTGESIPIEKTVGSKIISATVNKSGFVKARAVKVGEDTTIAQIIKLVEEASASKAPIARLADKIAGVFVPIVMSIAVIVFLAWLIAGYGTEFALARGITVLVISCPCALGLATPVAIMVGTGKGAENGILIKSGDALQAVESIDTVVFDKTGTLTEGKPEVIDVKTYNGFDSKTVLYYAASLEQYSEHPLAKAVTEKYSQYGKVSDDVTDFEAVFGKGVIGTVEGNKCFVGSLYSTEEYIDDEIKNDCKRFSLSGKTPLVVIKNSEAIGVIAVADKIRESSVHAVKRLTEGGIKVVMLTGDNETCANAVAEKIGIKQVVAGVLPQDKEKVVTKLKETGKVAMVGDGINDAPSLVAADVGIAIGAGTDVAVESADAVLMKNDPEAVAEAIILGKGVMRNIKQNLFWAFIYNGIGIPLAAGVLYPALNVTLSPMIGAVAMSMSSVCVVGNALRLKALKLNGKIKHVLKRNKKENGMQEVIKVEGMMCGHCAARVKTALCEIKGVSDAEVNLEEKTVVVKLNKETPRKKLISAIKKTGYDAN